MIETIQPPQSLPHSEESERAVLAGILLEPSQVQIVSGRLEPEDFHSEVHRILFRSMLQLQTLETTIDMRTLQAQLEQEGRLQSVGGVAYLAALDLDLPDLGRLDSYVEIVKERSVRRRLIHTCAEITRNCLDGGLRAQEALSRAEQTILSLGQESINKGFQPISRVVQQTMAELEERPDQGLIGVPSGFIDLDAKTRGLNPGNLIIIAGRPGMGKTSLALNMAHHVGVRENKGVGVFSLEMSDSELALRLLSGEADIPFGPLRSGHLSQRQWGKVVQAVRTISAAPIFIDDSPNPTLLEIASKARRLRAEAKLDLLIIDYLQLMQAGGRYENRNLEIAAITRGLKQLAKELKIPVIALSQLSRQTERRTGDHRPQLSDLRESGSIEQDADIVAFIYREEIYDPETEDQGMAELILAKHRNGETGTIRLVFLGETTKFCNLARQEMGGPPPPF